MAKKRKSTKRKSTSRAMIVRAPSPIINVRSAAPVHRKKHHVRRHHGGGGGGGNGELSLPRLGKLAGIAGIMGYTVGDKAPKKLEILDKIPDIGKLPKEAIIAGIAYVLRRKSPWIRDIALVGSIVAGNKLGANEFKLSGYYAH